MIPFLWFDMLLLASCSVIAALDMEVQWGEARIGRPVYGLLVLAGLLVSWAAVLRDGALPPPSWGIVAFAVAYLPFLSCRFIDLPTTDRLAVEELEEILLRDDFGALRRTSGSEVLRVGRRRLRVEWEGRAQGAAAIVWLTVHPSLLPVTVSRPHVARVEGPGHLEQIRGEIRERRSRPPGA